MLFSTLSRSNLKTPISAKLYPFTVFASIQMGSSIEDIVSIAIKPSINIYCCIVCKMDVASLSAHLCSKAHHHHLIVIYGQSSDMTVCDLLLRTYIFFE